MKDHQLKNGGTDNPAFLADANTGDRATVGRAGLTRIVRVSSSAIDSGSLGIELSSKEDGGRIIYMCKHNDGSKGIQIQTRKTGILWLNMINLISDSSKCNLFLNFSHKSYCTGVKVTFCMFYTFYIQICTYE